MENLLIKKKPYVIISQIDDTTHVVSFKGKQYVAYKFEPKSLEFNDRIYCYKRIQSSGVRFGKVKVIDKKNGYIVREYIEGISVFHLLAGKDLEKDIYKFIFSQASLAKTSRIALNFAPDNWIIHDGHLYYTGYQFYDYSEKTDFANSSIRLWFFTKDFVKFAKEKGVEVNVNRLKDDYVINKEIVMIACEFYR